MSLCYLKTCTAVKANPLKHRLRRLWLSWICFGKDSLENFDGPGKILPAFPAAPCACHNDSPDHLQGPEARIPQNSGRRPPQPYWALLNIGFISRAAGNNMWIGLFQDDDVGPPLILSLVHQNRTSPFASKFSPQAHRKELPHRRENRRSLAIFDCTEIALLGASKESRFSGERSKSQPQPQRFARWERNISPRFSDQNVFIGCPHKMSVPTCLSSQDLEGLTEVLDRMSARMFGAKLSGECKVLMLLRCRAISKESHHPNRRRTKCTE